MKQFIEPADGREEMNYWIPIANILAAVLLLLLAIFAVQSALIGTKGVNASGTSGTSQTQTAGVRQEGTSQAQSGIALAKRENEIAAREKVLVGKEAALKEITDIRTGIIGELSQKLRELKLPVEINSITGNIRFTEAVLFGINQDTVNTDGQKNLERFIPVYLETLLQPKYVSYLDQIVIEGHADNGGTYQYNLELSQKRADAVANFILSRNLARLPDGSNADKYFTVSARSFNVPVLSNGVPDRNRSRRVEFVFRLKDEEVFQKLMEMDKGDK